MSLNYNDNNTFTIGYLKEEYPERRCIYGKIYAKAQTHSFSYNCLSNL